MKNNNICDAIFSLNKEMPYSFIPFLSQEQLGNIKNFQLQETLMPGKVAYLNDVESATYIDMMNRPIQNYKAAKYLAVLVKNLRGAINACKDVIWLGGDLISATYPHLYPSWHWDLNNYNAQKTNKGNNIKAIVTFHGQSTLFIAYDDEIYSVKEARLLNDSAKAKVIAQPNPGELAFFLHAREDDGAIHSAPVEDNARLVFSIELIRKNPNPDLIGQESNQDISS